MASSEILEKSCAAILSNPANVSLIGDTSASQLAKAIEVNCRTVLTFGPNKRQQIDAIKTLQPIQTVYDLGMLQIFEFSVLVSLMLE